MLVSWSYVTDVPKKLVIKTDIVRNSAADYNFGFSQEITESERYCVFSKMKKGILGVICKRLANHPSRGLGTPPLNKGGLVCARVERRSPT